VATSKSKKITLKAHRAVESRLSYKKIKLEGSGTVIQAFFMPNSSRNAFGEAEAKTLQHIVRLKDVHGLIWTGQGTSTFCSGGDLAAYSQMKNLKTEGNRVNRFITKVLEELASAPFPTVVAVDGDCWGGGVELLSAFDYILATPSSLFGLWQTRMSLIPGWGGYRRLADRLPEAQVKSLLLRQNPLTAGEARQLGLVDELASLGQLRSTAEAQLTRMMRVEPRTQLALRRLTAKNEQKLFSSLWGSAEHKKKLVQKF
jgi:enoyl-CoA hydratase